MTHYNWKQIVKESLGPLFLAAIFSMASGFFLNSGLDIKQLAAILLVIPAFVNIAGDISAVVASRISTELYMGRRNMIVVSVVGGLLVSIILSVFLGIAAETLLNLTGSGLGYTTFVAITGVAGTLATLILIGSAVLLEFLGQRLGMDPSDLSIPLLSNLGDAVGVGLLILTAKTILGV